MDVWNWIKSNWPLLVAILLGPIAVAALEVYKHWATVKAGAAAVYDWFVTTWRTLTGYITAPFDAAWGGIENAFRGMVNGIIDIWNGLHFTLPKINAGPIHIGGETVGVPRIPHLAQGGLITSTGIVYAHAGEAITPAPDVGPVRAGGRRCRTPISTAASTSRRSCERRRGSCRPSGYDLGPARRLSCAGPPGWPSATLDRRDSKAPGGSARVWTSATPTSATS